MISKNELELLIERKPVPGSPVLTVYLNTDLSLEANIDRGFEIILKDLLRDIEQGLIDFPGTRDGKEVFLCWRMGEDAVNYWHDPDTGFAGRRPL